MNDIMKKILTLVFGCISALMAQNPMAGSQLSKPTIFSNAQIFVGNGSEIKNGFIAIDKGLIVGIGESGQASSQFSSFEVKDMKGKHIYPGLIAPCTQLGLTEIEAVRTTSDYQEIGTFNPNVRTLIAFNTDSEVIPTVRSNGVLLTQTTPVGGLISGRSSVMYLDGWNYEDAALKADDGIWINWPARISNSFDFATFQRTKKKNENYDKEIKELETYFQNAKIEKSSAVGTANLKYAAVSQIMNDLSRRIYIVFNTDKEALDALSFFGKLGVNNLVLVGAPRTDLLIDILKEKNTPILIPDTHRLPEMDDDELWDAYKLPKKLMDKGLTVGLYYPSYWRSRNIGFVAGNAAGHGLSKAQALSMITLNNAKILGVDEKVGSLEKGKHASFIVSEGDILDMRTAKVVDAYIRGAQVNLDDKQKRLAEKYFKKYRIK
jgi:imidazolonepropionase-like amidohydrolase